MVLKNVAVDILNKYIGDYVENVDKSQLKVNILGGNVVLENLILKQNALDSLDLPVQVNFGSLAKLVLTIDWANLSSGKIEVSIEGLFLLVVPNQEVKYEAEKEDRILLLSKQSTLQKVEEGKKQTNVENDRVKGNNSYSEKLTTTLVKNIFLKIKDIHIRYEDNKTHEGSPFSIGFTLYNLSVHTHLGKPMAPLVTEQIHKMLKLEGLSIYWNSNSMLFTESAPTRKEILEKFREEHTSKNDHRIKYKRILGPINATAQLALNPKPEEDTPKFSIPKAIFNVQMEETALQITKQQYQDVMMLANSMDIMIRRQPFRKFRPFLFTYKTHYKEWWKYAYTCVVEREVRQRKLNWNWEHISRHRTMCKSYAVAYQTKLQTSNKIPPKVSSILDECELNLDIFNLLFIRQRIEKEVERLGKIKKASDKKKGWFSSWFGGEKNNQSDQNDIVQQFKNAMTEDDMSKFYEAIDYHENIAPAALPVEFVATEFNFSLKCLLLNVSDDTTDVLTSKLTGVQASFKNRPAANGLRVDVGMRDFTVTGVKHHNVVPHLVTSKQMTPHTSLLNVMFEINPLDGLCGKRIKVLAQPLQMVYDAPTIRKINDVFKIPEKSSALTKLRQATKNKLSDLREEISVDILNALRQRTVYDIDVEIFSSYLILPHSGSYKSNTSCAVVNLGAINVKSVPRSKNALNIPQQLQNNAGDEELLEQAKIHSYDKFVFVLSEIQVIVAFEGEDWRSSILNSAPTPLHLLQPTSLQIEIEKCLITDNPRLPKIKLNGHLPLVHVNVSEGRVVKLMEVLHSLDENKEVDTLSRLTIRRSSSLTLLKYFDPVENTKRQNERRLTVERENRFVQLIELEATFTMREFKVSLLKTTERNPFALISFALKNLKLSAVQRTSSLTASAELGAADMILQPSSTAEALHLLSTGRDDLKQYLFTIKYQNVDKLSPDFCSKYRSVEQLIELDFTSLQLLLHLEGIQQLIKIAEDIKMRLRSVQGVKNRVGSAGPPLSNIQEEEQIPSPSTPGRDPLSFRYRRESQEITGLKVVMVMEHVGVEIATQQRSLARMCVKGLDGEIIIKSSKTKVTVNLRDFQVSDPNPATIHKQIVSVIEDNNALKLHLVTYNKRHTANFTRNDMEIEANISRLRMVFLNQFVSPVTKFLGNFQTVVKAAKEAWDKALDTVKDNLITARKRVALNIKFETPTIIIPQNSKSYDAVLANLGSITVKTNFNKKFVNQIDPAIVQELNLALVELKLSRIVFISNAYQIRSEKILLKPTTFDLIAKWNLSSSWYTEIPDFDVDAKLGAITLKLANSDLKMLVSILSENLVERREQRVQPTWAAQSLAERREAILEFTRMRRIEIDSQNQRPNRRVRPVNPPSRIRIKFSLTMDILTIDIMSEVSLAPGMSPNSSNEIGLAKLSLRLLTVKGNVNRDKTIEANLSLKNCELDDTRPNRETKLTHFMGKSTNVTISMNCRDKGDNMIVATYVKKGFDSKMDWQIFNFNLILSMEFLIKIGDFVASGLSAYRVPHYHGTNAPPIPDRAGLRGDSGPSRIRQAGLSPMTERFARFQYMNIADLLRPAEGLVKGKTIFHMQLEKPNIILLESMEGRQECQAIVFSSEVFFKMRIQEEERVIDCSIDNIQLFTSSFGRSGEQLNSRVSVLEPCSAYFKASTQENMGWLAEISFRENYNLKVSPVTINLFQRVLVTMVKPDAAPEASLVESNPSVIEKLKTFQKYMYSVFKRETTAPNEEGRNEWLKFNLTMSQVGVEISSDNRPLALLTVAGLKAGVVITSSGIQLMAALRDIQVIDHKPDSLHKQILSIVDGEAFRAQLVMHNMELPTNVNRIDAMELRVHISCIKIVYLDQFVSSVLNFLQIFKAAVDAIKRVLIGTVEWTKVNFMSTDEHSTKMSVQLQLKAPIIMIPQNSQSYNAVLADLGEVTLTSKFSKRNLEGTSGITVQELMLDLYKFKLSHVMLTASAQSVTVSNEKILLQPTTFRIRVIWNLSSLWYTGIPKMQFVGKMAAIKLKVANSDINNVMQILRENLSEERNQNVEASPGPGFTRPGPSNTFSQTRGVTAMDTANMIIGSTVEASTPNTVLMKFIFSIESLTVELMTESSASLQTPSEIGPSGEVGLAQVSLLQLSIKGNKFSNESVEVTLGLKDCQLDDTRPNRESKITRFMERKTQEDPTALINVSTDDSSMIEVHYMRKPLQTEIDLQVFNFKLVLSIEFLLKIGHFLTSGLSTLRPPSQPYGRYSQSVQSVDSRVGPASNDLGVSQYINIPSAASLLGPVKRGNKEMMSVTLKLKQPDIILVESMEGRESCQAMVFNSKADFKMSIKNDQKEMKGSIEDLQLFACRFGRFGEQSISRCSILAPCSVLLSATTSPQKGWNVDISFTDIAINISPATIYLLNRVMKTMAKPDAISKKNVVGSYPDLWNVKPIQNSTFWFLKPEKPEEAMYLNKFEVILAAHGNPSTGEICRLIAPSIVLTVETGRGTETMPMLNMQASLNGIIKDWNSQLNMECTWSMQASYYNKNQALWEPLLEPVEVFKGGLLEYIPWELKMHVEKDKKVAADKELSVLEPDLSVQITSSQPLELTITTTALQVMRQLHSSFTTAINSKLYQKSIYSPYLLKNETELTVWVMTDKGSFEMFTESIDGGTNRQNAVDNNLIKVNSKESLPLKLRAGLGNSIGLNKHLPDWKLYVMVGSMYCELGLPVVRADNRLFHLKGQLAPGQPEINGNNTLNGCSLISQVSMVEGAMRISLHSTVQICNNFLVPVEVFYMPYRTSMESLGYVQPKAVMNFPLKAVSYTTYEIFFSVEGYKPSTKSYLWKNIRDQTHNTKTSLLECESENPQNRSKFFIQVRGTRVDAFVEYSTKYPTMCSKILISPTMILRNTLPVDITVSVLDVYNPQELTAKPGDTLHLPLVVPDRSNICIKLPSYLDKLWVCTRKIPTDAPELDVWTFDSQPTKEQMDLGMSCTEVNGSLHYSLYCPFWMLNKTGLFLSYWTEELRQDACHPCNYTGPVLFSSKPKNFFNMKKVAVRVGSGIWSDKFSLDIPKTSQVISCENSGFVYKIGVSDDLTYNSLTRQVTFTPYITLINTAPFAIQCQEPETRDVVKIEAHSSAPFWPKSPQKEKLMKLKVANKPGLSVLFEYTKQQSTLLRLKNEHGGIHVETLVAEGGVYVTLGQYHPGLAPALVINHTPYEVNLWQEDMETIQLIKGKNSAMFTWENPVAKRMLIVAGSTDIIIETDLLKDGSGEFVLGDDDLFYWSSFLDGMQRVLLLSSVTMDSTRMADAIQKVVILSIQGIGLSLINTALRQEVMYISIASSDVIWEVSKMTDRRYKAVSMAENTMLEEGYQRFLADCEAAGKMLSGAMLLGDNKTEVDFASWRIFRPQQVPIRRSLQPGLWVQYGRGRYRSHLNVRLHRLQADQQLPAPTFPVVLAPIPPPRRNASQQALKPFMELCIIQHIMDHTSVRQFKYCKLLVQEFHVKIDIQLIHALVGMHPEDEISESIAAERFSLDMEAALRPLGAVVAEYTASDQKHFFDHLHLSPLKIHMSLLLGNILHMPSAAGNLLKAMGAKAVNMDDILFKLAYYERTYCFLSWKELFQSSKSHYRGQIFKQLYVLIFNPFGIATGLTKGFEDLFYEPFQGDVGGGVVYGVRSVLGQTVGGAAGTVSRITDAMGHGFAALSLDSKFQNDRREKMSKPPPANLQEGLKRGGKDLFMGVFTGVTGVITQPISGAREEGALGFFKGLGKGAVGLVARPATSVADVACGSFEFVKRTSDLTPEISKMRPARFFEVDGLVLPYSKFKAQGQELLRIVGKEKYNSEVYVHHVSLMSPVRDVVLCTSKRIIYLEKGKRVEWSFIWPYLSAPLKELDNGVYIKLKENRTFSSGANEKVIYIHGGPAKRKFVEVCTKCIKDYAY